MGYGKLYTEVFGSHTEDEWQALVRKYMWRCFYCGSPMSAWRDWKSGRIYEIRARNADRPWETSGKVMSFVELSGVAPELVLTKDHLVPLFYNNVRVEEIWNIRPCDLRCNRLKGQKTAIQFRNERPGLISQLLSSLPADDWRVQEWNQFPTDDEIEAAIERRFPQNVDVETQKSTGVFAVSGLASDLGVDLGFEAGGDVEIDLRQAPEDLKGGGLVVDSTSLPGVFCPEDIRNFALLKALREERERLSYYWRSAK